MSRPTDEQLAALQRLWAIAQHDHGGAVRVLQFLLGLYNGDRFKFDLTNFRGLDSAVFKDCLTVLVMDYSPWQEVHMLLGSKGYEFEALAYRRGIKGKARKAAIEHMLQVREFRKQVQSLDFSGSAPCFSN